MRVPLLARPGAIVERGRRAVGMGDCRERERERPARLRAVPFPGKRLNHCPGLPPRAGGAID
eukprot:15437314-Alexandrium_andersonii.AAC.1